MRGACLRFTRTSTLLVALTLAAGSTAAQPAAPDSAAFRSGPSPRGALLRSAVLPGWGQVYNGQVFKAPIIAAAIGGLVFAAVRLNGDYVLYRRAYQYKAWQELVDRGTVDVNPHAALADDYQELADRLGPVSSRPLLAQRDALRRNRDLAFLGIGVVWALSALDAYVNAHLLDFDVGENLSVHVRPAADPAGLPALSSSLVWRPGGRRP